MPPRGGPKSELGRAPNSPSPSPSRSVSCRLPVPRLGNPPTHMHRAGHRFENRWRRARLSKVANRLPQAQFHVRTAAVGGLLRISPTRPDTCPGERPRRQNNQSRRIHGQRKPRAKHHCKVGALPHIHRVAGRIRTKLWPYVRRRCHELYRRSIRRNGFLPKRWHGLTSLQDLNSSQTCRRPFSGSLWSCVLRRNTSVPSRIYRTCACRLTVSRTKTC